MFKAFQFVTSIADIFNARMSRVKGVIIALPNKYFIGLGLFLPGS
jgi:hypothetical protein